MVLSVSNNSLIIVVLVVAFPIEVQEKILKTYKGSYSVKTLTKQPPMREQESKMTISSDRVHLSEQKLIPEENTR